MSVLHIFQLFLFSVYLLHLSIHYSSWCIIVWHTIMTTTLEESDASCTGKSGEYSVSEGLLAKEGK